MEKPQFVDTVANHIREKASAYALVVAVGIGSLALMADGGHEDPSGVTDNGAPAITNHPFEAPVTAAGN